ncbi:DUF1572 domain-containing protein [Subsaxibacter sp. CAU 1640]|uniref:DUF1572 family protein n=1 Tax=Subsaxibacter sp. CAU 1640 TaxID=2933271 RepID=UPI0020033F46|nr:DUF1572 family protein [Subsaxibacter sp. CAU 1640]MCK7591151.1 DUF1572 domain-containing protein [Subsaxibacter sp. CAU 1640]
MENAYISGVLKQFNYYKSLGDKTFEQLSFEDMNYQPNHDSNSISIIVKHMVGNMLSRWTNFLTEDGEKPWRNRDEEFESTYTTKEELLQEWEKGWKCLFDAIAPLSDDDLNTIVYIRNEGHTVAEAIFRQLGHYPYHVGQITYIGKLLKGDAWQSLSIPKGASKSYNQDKFNKPKERKHFTDEV